jgi:UDP-2-acetamido-2-deoxy-ribo-hexuluronate aminotransferase
MNATTVPFIDLSRIVKKIRGPVLASWEQVLDGCEFVAPPRVAALEATLCKSLNSPNAYCCANGTDALTLALHSFNLAGKLVAVPNVTFWASYEAILSIGAKPVLIDIDPVDYQVSLEELKKAHQKFNLSGLVFPHLFGFASKDLTAIRAFCKAQNIKIVEDGAQCYGVEVDHRGVLADAELATLSFYPAKVIGGCMDGGAVIGTNKELVALARCLGNHGRSTHYSYSHVGYNSRMGGLQAAFLNEVLKLESDIVASRLSALSLYQELYEATPQIHEHVSMILPPAGVKGNGYLSVFKLTQPNADAIKTAMQARGVGVGRTYPETLSQQICCANDLRSSELTTSLEFCKRVINLPLFAYITADECRYSFEAFTQVLLGKSNS